jgi:hypothetical protein
MTCQTCTRQHDFPDGWPARAAMRCWNCDTLYVAEKRNEVRPATPTELAGFKQTEVYKAQSRVAAFLRETFKGRTGIIPADEFAREAQRAARELGLLADANGFIGAAAINRKTGEGRDVVREAPVEINTDGDDCLHCLVMKLIELRSDVEGYSPETDLAALLVAAAQIEVAVAKAEGIPLSELEKAFAEHATHAIRQVMQTATEAAPAKRHCH